MRSAATRTARFSGQCAVAERGRRRGAALLLGLLACVAAPLGAQQPLLRVGNDTVAGTLLQGSAAFPAATLERLGFRLAGSDAALIATVGTDTLRFWPTSPFFRAGSAVHQLAYPVMNGVAGVLLPEQFFIQWLPAQYPERFEYRGGVLLGRGAATAVANSGSVPAPQRAPEATPPPAPQTPANQGRNPGAAARPAAGRLVVIDPGHGGRDPGKVGPNGLRESDVALMISQRLATVLRERGYEVHLTRTSDTFIPLAERTRLANQWQAGRAGAVFLSIHANAFTSATVRGFETFFLSEARTDDERRVAEMENAVIRFEDNPQRPAGNGLDQVLLNLHSEYLTRASHDLAAIMQDRMATFHPGPNRGVKRAPFYVLVGAVMPAVLIETAFISNREEANLLGTQSFQQRIAWGIAEGVDEFFRRNEHLWAGSSQ
jgi:N-acetylmuramoyl-L-alanine amidase